jgi:hypothetical protein
MISKETVRQGRHRAASIKDRGGTASRNRDRECVCLAHIGECRKGGISGRRRDRSKRYTPIMTWRTRPSTG